MLNVEVNLTDVSINTLLLNDIPIGEDLVKDTIYIVCCDNFDYPDYPLHAGDLVIPTYNGVILVTGNGVVRVIDKYTFGETNLSVPIQPRPAIVTLTIS